MESSYKASITREQFLFYEMKTTAKLLAEGIDDEEAINRVVSENLFQYPTEREIKRMAKVCCRRLRGMNDMDLIAAIATKPQDVSRQICLYAMMKEHKLIRDFMLTVIAETATTLNNKATVKAMLNNLFAIFIKKLPPHIFCLSFLA